MEPLPEEVRRHSEETEVDAGSAGQTASQDNERSGLVNANNNTKPNMMNVVNNIMCLVFVMFLTYLSFVDGVVLFSFHPTLMSLGWLLLMISAINALSPGDAVTEVMPVQSRTTRHWILQACGLGCITIGFVIIVSNKIINNKDHFTSVHSCFGLTAFILALLTSSGGILTLYAMKLRKIVAPVNIKILHSIAGLLTFTVGMMAIMLGLFSEWWKAGEGLRYTFLLVSIGILVLTLIRPSIKTFVRVRERLTYIRSAS